MNGGEGGITVLDVAAVLLAVVGCLLLHLGRRLGRNPL